MADVRRVISVQAPEGAKLRVQDVDTGEWYELRMGVHDMLALLESAPQNPCANCGHTDGMTHGDWGWDDELGEVWIPGPCELDCPCEMYEQFVPKLRQVS